MTLSRTSSIESFMESFASLDVGRRMPEPPLVSCNMTTEALKSMHRARARETKGRGIRTRSLSRARLAIPHVVPKHIQITRDCRRHVQEREMEDASEKFLAEAVQREDMKTPEADLCEGLAASDVW